METIKVSAWSIITTIRFISVIIILTVIINQIRLTSYLAIIIDREFNIKYTKCKCDTIITSKLTIFHWHLLINSLDAIDLLIIVTNSSTILHVLALRNITVDPIAIALAILD